MLKRRLKQEMCPEPLRKEEDILRQKEAGDSRRHFAGLDVVADSPILFSLPDPLLRLAPVSSPHCAVPV